MTTQIRGSIEEAKQSQSGKTLGVKINGTWYQTKAFELANEVGRMITGSTSTSEWQGRTMHWLNDWSHAVPTADDAMSAAMTGSPQPAQSPNKELNITALALVKCIEGISSPQQAVASFEEVKQLLTAPPPPANDFDDDIPF